MIGFFKESEPVMMNTVTLNEENVNSFHHAISSVVVTAQCFGLLPVLGITGPNTASVRFRWCSFRTVFSIFILLGTGLNMCFSIVLMRSGVSFKESDGMAFFGTVTITYMLFLQLARQWPTLISEWENLEISQKHYGYPRRLCLKIKIMTVIVLTGALVEHALSKASGIMTAVACTDNITDVFRYYFTRTGTYDQMFAVMEYSITTAILTLITNFIATFTWNFPDLFIILMSLALTERFRLFNQNLDSVRGKLLTESFWSQIREEYNSLSHLTRTLDSCISKIVLVSFASNLYFICRQLLSSLSPLHGLVNTVYFCWSFGFVLFRAVTLSLYASRIYDESLLPKRVLYDVPPESYKVEVSRFLNQIVTDTVALSGMNFFYITRTLLLTLAGTIVTYEIVLVQLNSISLVGINSECGHLQEFTDPLSTIIPMNTVDKVIASELVGCKKESMCKPISFHRSFNSVIVIAQCFGLMPVSGITGPSASFIRFSWFSLRVIYTVLSLTGTFFMTCLCVMRFFKYDRTFEETQCSVFYGCSFSRMLLFLLLARHWPALAHRWEQVESVLAHHGYPHHHHHHHHKVNVIIAMFLSAAFIEHIFSHVRVIRLAVLCAIEDGMDGICTYFFNSFPHVYDYIPCSLWNGVIVFLINVLCAFAWTYMDLFIVLMSVALADKFRQLNRCLQSVQGKPTPPRFWHQMREDYNTLSCLVMRVDSCMSKIVFLSFANNLYTVCIQLFNSLHLPQNAVQMVYFCLSFGYVLLRIVAVSLSAASINEQSSQVRNILYTVPATSFSKEVQRFLQQVTTYEIALTGLNLFSVKRTLLLKVAATIVTYELILVQFSAIHADERDLTAHSVAKRYCL